MTTQQLTPAQMFVLAHLWATEEHAEHVASHHSATGIPFCTECADWHTQDDDHSLVENPDYSNGSLMCESCDSTTDVEVVPDLTRAGVTIALCADCQ